LKCFLVHREDSVEIGIQKGQGDSLQCVPGQGPADRPVDRHAQHAQAQPDRPPGRPWKGERSIVAVDWLVPLGFC